LHLPLEEFKAKFFTPLSKREYEEVSENMASHLDRRDLPCDVSHIEKCIDELSKKLNRTSSGTFDKTGDASSVGTPRTPGTPHGPINLTPRGSNPIVTNTLGRESRLRTSLFDLDFDKSGGREGVTEKVSSPRRPPLRISSSSSKRDDRDRDDRDGDDGFVSQVVTVLMSDELCLKLLGWWTDELSSLLCFFDFHSFLFFFSLKVISHCLPIAGSHTEVQKKVMVSPENTCEDIKKCFIEKVHFDILFEILIF
jgi:hypothetical protein